MSFQPSSFSYSPGVSGTTTEAWMKSLYRRPEPQGQDQDQAAGEPVLRPLEAPSPWGTVALVSTKEAVDHLGQLETAVAASPPAVEWVLRVGHIALGVGAFVLVVWGVSTAGAAISASAPMPNNRGAGAGAPRPAQGGQSS